MNRKAFVKKLNKWYICNSNEPETHTVQYAGSELLKLEKAEAQGDFIYESDSCVIGRYYYSITILPEASKDSRIKELHFCAYGFGTKYNITDNDYELADYSEFEYVIL